MATTHLTELPRLSELYPQAVTRAVRERAGKRRGRPAVNPQLPDRALQVGGVRARPGQLAAYQRLVGEPLSQTLPAGFVHVLSFPLSVALMNGPGFPLSLFGLVHLANRVEYLHPLCLGQPFTLHARMVNLRAHRRGLQVDAVAEAKLGWKVAWRGVSTYLARGAASVPGLPPAPPDAGQRPVPPGLPTACWRLAAGTGRAYAKVSGDANPIHLSAATARLLGFKRPIVHGMYSAARALAAVGPARGERYDWDVEFFSPIYLPAQVAFALDKEEACAGEPGNLDGYRYAGWDASRGRVHFTGSVRPLQ